MNWIEYIGIAVVLAITLLNVLPFINARRLRGRAVPALDSLISEEQRRKPRLLVYFWSPSCGMCRSMTPVMDDLAHENGAVIKVNIVDAVDVAKAFGVMATPSVAVIEKGVVKKMIVGAMTEARIRGLFSDQRD